MKLARFIETNMEQLLQDWEEAVVEIAPELKGKDSVALRDHAREMLVFITKDLMTSQTDGESALKALGKGKALVSEAGGDHGTQRQGQGLSIHQMTQELRALRARVTKAWGDEQGGLATKDINELVRFNEAIDQMVAASMSSFSALKNQVTRLFETMLKASPDPAAVFDPDGKYLFLNDSMADLVDATLRDVIGKTPREVNVELAPNMYDAITTSVTTGQIQRVEHHYRFRSGREAYVECQFVPVFNDSNEIEAVIKTSRDITERKQTEHQIWQSANFDLLTGLPNRRLFIDRLEQTLLEAQRKGSCFALVFIDLDGFKQANDQLGHKAGDKLLALVAERLGTSVRAMDTVARFGGDEFTLILKETDRDGAKEAAEALLNSLEKPFEVDSHRVNISGSIGLAIFPGAGEAVDELMHNADQAMYSAKEQGGQQIQVYESSMSRSRADDLRLKKELDDALSKNQLVVYYQPIIDIRTGAVFGAEALLRWNHPHKGLLTPTDFLNVTERNGMPDRINAYVLEQAVTCQLRWRDLSGEAFPIHINESPTTFVTRNLVDQWRERLTQIGLNESWITMELTPAAFNVIHASGFNPGESLGLQDLRLKLAVNDFGIEPFSLLALQEFQMDSVKIDRELIRNAGQGGKPDRVLEGIIAMSHAIDVRVVAVGVETDEQLQFLSRAGCDYAQGYLFSKPLTQGDFEALLRQSRQKKLS